MPDFTVKEIRLPELHLPEVKRDEIVRALSGIHVPEVGLARVERRPRLRGIDLDALPWRQHGMLDALPWRQHGMSGVDAGKLVVAAITAARIARPTPRPRWSPFRRSRWSAVSRSRGNLVAVIRSAPRRSRRRIAAVVIALAATVGWMLIRNPAFRSRLDRAAHSARRRIDEMRFHSMDDMDLETGQPVSAAAAEVAAVDTADTVPAAGAGLTEQATSPA